MADDLPGSFEHAPPNLIELAARDRRWCQGNLQHARLLGTSGLHPLSRLHLFMGVMSYLASPLWLLFLLSGMSLALHAYLVPPDYFLDRWSLFPDWPRIDPERAMALFGICMLVLYAPEALRHRRLPARAATRAACAAGTVFGLLAELLLSALVAPIMMLVQTSSVIQILTGRDSGWSAQARDADRVPWSLLWRFHRRHMLVGAAPRGRRRRDLLAAPRLDEPRAPRPRPRGAALGLHGQRRAPAAGCARIGPAHHPRGARPRRRSPRAADREADDAPRPRRGRRTASPASSPIPTALARHLAWLDAPTARRPGEPDAALASALLKLADGLGRSSALDAARDLRRPRLAPRRSRASRRAGRPTRRRADEAFVMLAATTAVRCAARSCPRRSAESVT